MYEYSEEFKKKNKNIAEISFFVLKVSSMVNNEGNLQLITKLVALLVQMKVCRIFSWLDTIFFFSRRNSRKVKVLFWNYMRSMKPMKTSKNLFILHYSRKTTKIHPWTFFHSFVCQFHRTYKQCVESSLTQFKSGLNNRPGLGLLRSFLHSQTDFSDEQTNNSSINQTFFSV